MISIVAGTGQFQVYQDLLANVRYDGKFHSVKSLVQPDDPTVRDIARVLVQAKDFIKASQEFVDSFTTYKTEVGDYWAKPSELLATQKGDCDDKAILLTSILRNYIPADQVYCAFGIWLLDGEESGHMYVLSAGEGGEDRIIESTAGPERQTRGKYILYGMFNDKYAFSTDIGLREFNLRKVELEKPVVLLQERKTASQKKTTPEVASPMERCNQAYEKCVKIMDALDARLKQTPKPSEVWNGAFM